MDYSIIRNSEIIYGNPGDKGIIKSPFFPSPYPRDYTGEIKFQGRDATALIRINFEDFQLTPWSFIEIFDSNQTRSHVLTGNSFRPPVLTSQGNSILIRFYANGGRATGFKFSYEFLKANNPNISVTAITDCGGWVDNMGGAITMMNMTPPNTTAVYDCLWLLKPQVNFQLKSNLAVRVAQFSISDRYSTLLEIRQGLTSESSLIANITSLKIPTSEFIVPWDAGFYIRLRGVLKNDFKMALIYTTFTYSLVSTDCFSYTDFLCRNHRCIHSDLRCDGFDHCGDLSDEPSVCRGGSGTTTPQDPAWWYTHTPNYYFPKTSDLVDIGATTFILLTATIGVVVFVASLIALLFRMSSHSRLMRERQARIEFLHSQLVANESAPPPPENPPSYEAPPEYAEIQKINEIKSLESEYRLDGRLRVLLPPTPVPVHRDAETMSISIISTAPSLEGLPGLENIVAGGSQASTPSCRSRAGTPRRKVRRQHKGTPRKCPTAIQENVPTSPPPSYEASEGSVFNFELPVEQVTEITADPDRTMDEKIDCNCPGACNCSNLDVVPPKEKTKFNWRTERGYSMPGFQDVGNRSLDIYFSHNQLHTQGTSDANTITMDERNRFRVVQRILSLNNVDRPRLAFGNKLWKSFSWPHNTRRLM